jgi:beta-lactamase regulating signal transducer with metallopeptidase domain
MAPLIFGELGERVTGWLTSILPATAVLLVAALLLDWALARRVSASVRLIPYLTVVARLAFVRWQNPLGMTPLSLPEVVISGSAGTASPPTVIPWIGLAYLLGATALLAAWVRARLVLRRALLQARPARASVARLLPADEVLEHATLGPFTTGLLRPRIVVPASLAEAGGEALACVLSHEAAHLARRDQWLLAVVQLACAVAWPVVPLWIAAARIRALVEVASDERALRGAGLADRRRYGEVLLAVACPAPLPGVPAFGHLRGRLRALAFQRRWPAVVQLALVVSVAAVVFACSGEPEPEVAPAPPTEERPPSMAAAIRQYQPDIKRCYEHALSREGIPSLRIDVTMTIRASGEVSGVSLRRSAAIPPSLDACLVRAMRLWKFPTNDERYQLEFPLILQGSR